MSALWPKKGLSFGGIGRGGYPDLPFLQAKAHFTRTHVRRYSKGDKKNGRKMLNCSFRSHQEAPDEEVYLKCSNYHGRFRMGWKVSISQHSDEECGRSR